MTASHIVGCNAPSSGRLEQISKMNVEENRLKTFTDWPANALLDATGIAKAGFYYTGHTLEVQCFLCGVKISDWNYGDQATVRHRLAEPECPFVQNPSATCNVPLIPVPSTTISLPSSSTEISQGNIVDGQRCILQRLNIERRERYKSLSKRLESFATWPISSIVSPEKLARSGFYYLQDDDQVQCVYCGGKLWQWEPGDDPDQEHKKHFPKCAHNMSKTICIPDFICLTTVRFTHDSSLSELGIMTHTAPRNPYYSTYERRLNSFKGWPQNLQQTPELLASAGFYYEEVADDVRCFHCDGGLRSWEKTDEAWTEHAKWYPKCEFVNLIRGKEFIQHCIDTRPPLDPSIFEGVPEDESIDLAEELSTSPDTILPPRSEIAETALERLSDIQLTINQTAESSCPELITTVNDAPNKQTNVNAEQCDTIEKNEHSVCSSKTENTVSNDKANALDKRINVNFKETVSLEKENIELREARLCKICMDREVAIVSLPCGHLATCVDCVQSLKCCPMCRQEIKAIVRTFLS